MKAREHYRITVVKPRKNDGGNWMLVLRAPAAQGRAPRRFSSGKKYPEEHAAAEKLAREKEAELNRKGRALSPDGLGADPDFADVYDAWLESLALVKTSGETIATRRSARVKLAAAFGELRDSTMTSELVTRGRDALLAAKLIASTVNAYMRWAATAWWWAHDRGIVRSEWRPPKKRLLEDATERRPFTLEEQRAVLAHWRERDPFWHGLFALAVFTGARVSDLVSFREGEHVKRGVREGWGLVAYDERKKVRELHRHREVYVPAEILALIPEREAGAFLFPSGKGHVTSFGARKALKVSLVALGLPASEIKKLGPHSFRRSTVADLEDAGVPQRAAMAFMNHRSAAIHERYKARAGSKDLEAAAALWELRGPALGDAVKPSTGSSTDRLEPSTESTSDPAMEDIESVDAAQTLPGSLPGWRGTLAQVTSGQGARDASFSVPENGLAR